VAAATDVGSEIASLQIWLDKPLSYGFGATGAPSGPFPLLLANGSSSDNWDDGQTSTAFNVSSFANPGSYAITSVVVVDLAGNEHTYTPIQLAALGIPTSIDVQGSQPDTTPPNLVSLSLPTTIDVSHGSQPITIVAAATDVGSKIASLQIWLDKPLSYGFGATGAPSGPFPLLLANGSSLDNWDDGQTSTAFNVSAFANPGSYAITSVVVVDLAGNEHTYTPSQLAALGIPASIKVDANAANDAPDSIVAGVLVVDENSPVGTLVGTFIGQDVDDSTLTYTLTDSAEGRFDIDNTGHLTVMNGLLLDFEQNSAHDVIVRATDPGGLFFEKAFTVAVRDVSPELLVGGPGADKVSAGNGNDQAYGNGGNDTINGGAGNDYLNGGADDDHLFGDAGKDTLLGDTGHDYLNAGLGDDLIMGGAGDDTVLGSDGDDYVNGQEGDDVVFGGEGADTVVGDSGNDYINGENGNDTVLGGSGNDTVLGGDGSDYINGGADDDQVFGGNSADVLIGDDGNDYLNGDAGNDNLTGGSGNDTLLGADGNDYLSGGTGHDNLTGGLGDDTLFAGAGSDYLKGDAGDDFFIFEANFGTSLIIDFETGTPAHHDFILFKGGVFADAADVLAHAVQQATNVVITASTGDSLTLANVQLANLVADDFRFA